MGKVHWMCLIGGMALGYFVLPTVVGVIRSRLG